MKRYESLLLCLALPAVALIIHLLVSPTSGLSMIFQGLASLITSLTTTVFNIGRAVFPWVAIPVVGYAVFKLKTARSEPARLGDYLCGAAAAASLILLQQHTSGWFVLFTFLWACSVLIRSGSGKYQVDAAIKEDTFVFAGAIIGAAFLELLTLLVAADAHHDRVEREQRGFAFVQKMDEKKALAEMYTVADPIAFAEADAQVSDMIKFDRDRLAFRTWLMTEAVDYPAHIDERGVEIMHFDRKADLKLMCFEGRHIKDVIWSPLSDALARRACALRAGLLN